MQVGSPLSRIPMRRMPIQRITRGTMERCGWFPSAHILSAVTILLWTGSPLTHIHCQRPVDARVACRGRSHHDNVMIGRQRRQHPLMRGYGAVPPTTSPTGFVFIHPFVVLVVLVVVCDVIALAIASVALFNDKSRHRRSILPRHHHGVVGHSQTNRTDGHAVRRG